MAAPQPQYSPKQVASSLHVSESSVKRWCDRGLISTVRTAGGHRRITLDGLNQFLQRQERTLVEPDLLGLPRLPPCRNASIPGSDQPLQQSFRRSLIDGDEEGCRRLLHEKISDGCSFSESAEDLITDAMHGVGDAWQCRELDAYQERRACDLCLRLINDLRSRLPEAKQDAPVAIGGAPEGDLYQLPTALVELSLREIGWRAVNLGNNLPMPSFIQAAHDYSPQMVWLSVSFISEPALFAAAENQLADALGDDVPLLVGGRALTDEIRGRLRYTAYCDSLRHLVEIAAIMRLKLDRNAPT